MSELLSGGDLFVAIETWLYDCDPEEASGIVVEDVLDLLATIGYPGASETYQRYLLAVSGGPAEEAWECQAPVLGEYPEDGDLFCSEACRLASEAQP